MTKKVSEAEGCKAVLLFCICAGSECLWTPGADSKGGRLFRTIPEGRHSK